METPVQPDFRVIRGPDWSYKSQDGGKGHAGTVMRLQELHRPHFPPNSVLVQWDSGDKGLYRAGYDQAYDLRILETANSVCHPKVWCDGCNTDEIRGIRWRCTECYAIDLCTTCYMNDEHDLSHVFMRVLSSHKTSVGPKMLPRLSSPPIALRGTFPGAKVVRYPQWQMRLSSDTLLGKVVRHRHTPEERVMVQAMVEFSSTSEGINFTKISCTLPGSGGKIYDGHLPLLGDLEPVNEGDNVLVIATPEELEKLHKRRGLWEPEMAKAFRRKGRVNGRTYTGDFEVIFSNSQEKFTMNSAALRKIHRLCLGQLVRISDDIAMVKRLQFGHGGWTATMKQAIDKVGKVVEIDGSDIHVRLQENRKFIFNPANLTPEKPIGCRPSEQSLADDLHNLNSFMKGPKKDITVAAASGDIRKVEGILAIHPEWINLEPKPGKNLLAFIAPRAPTSMMKFLVEKGAFIESIDNFGCTPLFNATLGNNHEAVRYLLEQGANVNATNFESVTSLANACYEGFSECAHYLLMHGADMNQRGEDNVTPLLLTINSGRKTIVDLIMDRMDADLKTVSEDGICAMHGAAASNNIHALTRLLDKVPRLVDARDNLGRTPLIHAVFKGSLNAAELLIKKGHCDVNAQDSELGFCPLATAISYEQFEFVDILVMNGADPNISANSGNTPLMMALDVIEDTQGKYMKEEPYMAEMKKKWRHLGIKTNPDALLAYLVSHGADLDANTVDNLTIRELLLLAQHHLLHALDKIQAQRGKDITRQQSTTYRPLRQVTKKTNSSESGANSESTLLKKKKHRRPSKKERTGNPSGLGSPSSGSQEKLWGKKSQLLSELQRKDEELETLRSKVKTLEHLVKKKISFACGHDVIKSIAELIPECPYCSEPIMSVVDLQ